MTTKKSSVSRTICSPIGSRWFWFVLAASVSLADQWSKAWVTGYLPYGGSIEVAPFFSFVHVLNEGAAFSLFADAGGWQRYFLTALALLISAGLVVLLLRRPDSTRDAAAYSLILGGAVGNVTDRMVRGAVVDYLDFDLGGWHWPSFNLADSAIAVGVLLMMWQAAATEHQGIRRINLLK